MLELTEERWLDDWNDPLLVAAALSHAGEWDVDLTLLVRPRAG